jgi:hypothetical protein|tara:strand:+ start:339 stop:497 length:159 start_codon:yes stop_codon:yes gene_type:complete
MKEDTDVRCIHCKCPCHCLYEKHSTWGGPPSEFSGECDCEVCEHPGEEQIND